jgi:hypothetical protein
VNALSFLVLQNILSNIAALWNLLLLVAAIATLLVFFYSIYLRRVFRARRIAQTRDRRLLREAAERESQK